MYDANVGFRKARWWHCHIRPCLETMGLFLGISIQIGTPILRYSRKAFDVAHAVEGVRTHIHRLVVTSLGKVQGPIYA